MNDSKEVEIDMTVSREKGRGEGRGKNEYHTQPSPSNAPKAKMERMIEAMERLLERFILNHIPPLMRNRDFKGTLCVEQARIAPEEL